MLNAKKKKMQHQSYTEDSSIKLPYIKLKLTQNMFVPYFILKSPINQSINNNNNKGIIIIITKKQNYWTKSSSHLITDVQ